MVLLLLAIAAIVPVVNSAFHQMFYDEVHTLRHYAPLRLHAIARTYDLPNNHIAFTMLLHVYLYVAGLLDNIIRPDYWVLRVPSVLASIAGYTGFYFLALRTVSTDRIIAALATIAFASVPLHAEFAFQLRGYALSTACYAIALAAVAWWPLISRRAFIVVAGTAILVAQYVVPTNVWIAGAIYIATAIHCYTIARPHNLPLWRKPVFTTPVLTVLAAGAIGAALYLPVLQEIRKTMRSPHSKPFVDELSSRLIQHGTNLATAISPFSSYALTIVIVLAGIYYVWRSRAQTSARVVLQLILPAALLVYPVAVLLSRAGYTRSYLPALPAFAVLMCWGVMMIHSLVPARLSAAYPHLLRGFFAVFAAACLASGALASRRLAINHQPETLARFIAKNAQQEVIVADQKMDYVSYAEYYAQLYGIKIPIHYPDAPGNLAQRINSFYVLAADETGEQDIRKHFNLQGADAGKLAEVARFGPNRVLKFTR